MAGRPHPVIDKLRVEIAHIDGTVGGVMSDQSAELVRGNDPRIKAELEWLYGKGGAYDEGNGLHPCLCDYAWTSAGRIQGINMGMAWHRQTTNHRCYHHGTEAQKFYDDNLRRFKRTGDWAEFHINRAEWERRQSDGSGDSSEERTDG